MSFLSESFTSTSTNPIPMDSELTNEELLDRCSNWTLACDNALLNKLQKLSEKLVNEAQEISYECNKLSEKISLAGNELNLITNQFFMLSNTQFIENKVEEFEETCTTPSSASVPAPIKSKADREAELIMQMKESIRNGMKVKQEFSNSRDQPVSQQLKLAHLIGSSKFFSSRFCGLADETKFYEVSSPPLPSLTTPAQYTEREIPKTNSTGSTPSTTDSFLKQPTGYVRELYRPPSTVQTVEKAESDSSEDLFTRKGFSSSSSSLATTSDMKAPSLTSTPETHPKKSFVDELNNVFSRQVPPPYNETEESDDDFIPAGGVQGMFSKAFQDSEIETSNNNNTKKSVSSDDLFSTAPTKVFSPGVNICSINPPPTGKVETNMVPESKTPGGIVQPVQETRNTIQSNAKEAQPELQKNPNFQNRSNQNNILDEDKNALTNQKVTATAKSQAPVHQIIVPRPEPVTVKIHSVNSINKVQPNSDLSENLKSNAQTGVIPAELNKQHTKEPKKDRLSIFEESDSDDDMFATNFKANVKPPAKNVGPKLAASSNVKKSIFDDDSDDGDLFAVVKKNTKVKDVAAVSLISKEHEENLDRALENFPPQTSRNLETKKTNVVEKSNAKQLPGFVKSVAAGLRINPLALKPGAKRPGLRSPSPQELPEDKKISSTIHDAIISPIENNVEPEEESAGLKKDVIGRPLGDTPTLPSALVTSSEPKSFEPKAAKQKSNDSKDKQMNPENKDEISKKSLGVQKVQTINTTSGPKPKPNPVMEKKSKSIFEDSDSDDELFGFKNKKNQLEPSTKSGAKTASLFDDETDEDLFIPRQSKTTTKQDIQSGLEANDSEIKKEGVGVSGTFLEDASGKNPLESFGDSTSPIVTPTTHEDQNLVATAAIPFEKNVEEKSDLLNCLTKDRSKVLQRRRPPSRKVRNTPNTQTLDQNIPVPEETKASSSTSKIESKVSKDNIFGDSSSDSEGLFK